mmetsp:Transcript_9358/g.20196  ORF Transcript_9358/g.20196 Transcript_9358/m.20196 type:complete len:91 (+) Transcript_9358:396-668(+)
MTVTTTSSSPLLFRGTLLNQYDNAIEGAMIQLWQTDLDGVSVLVCVCVCVVNTLQVCNFIIQFTTIFHFPSSSSSSSSQHSISQHTSQTF